MPVHGQLDFWWPVLIGTLVAFALVLGVIGLALVQQRTKLTLNAEKLAIIEKSSQKYSNLFNTVSDIVFTLTREGTIVQVNGAVTRLLGYSVDSVIGRNISEFIYPPFRSSVGLFLNQPISHQGDEPGGTASSGIVPVLSLRERAPKYLEYRSTRSHEDNSEDYIRGIARDITDRLKSERALMRSERRLRLLLDDSRLMQESLALLSQRMLGAQEEERRRISRVLHDEVGQILATVLVNLELIRKDGGANLVEFGKRVAEAKSLTELVIGYVRAYLSELRPETLDQLGLLSSIRQYAGEFGRRTGINVAVAEDRSIERIEDPQKLALYRVIQESLTNVERHAGAENVTIDIASEDDRITVEISDDGEGFDATLRGKGSPSMNPHLGLLSMHERAKLVGGEFSVSSIKGEGTTVKVEFMLRPELLTSRILD